MEVKKLTKNRYVKRSQPSVKIKALEVPVDISPATTREQSLRMAIDKWIKASELLGGSLVFGGVTKRNQE